VSETGTADAAPFDVVHQRESMRLRAGQSLMTLPVVAASCAGVYFAMRGRMDTAPLLTWTVLMSFAALLRAIVCLRIAPGISDANAQQLARYERWLWLTMALNSFAIGSSFWLIAAHGDLTMQVVITLLSCFYAIGALVNASSHFASFAAGTLLNLGQGTAFWLGLSSASQVRLEVALPFVAVMLLIISFGRRYSRQYRDSLRIRTLNLELLAKRAADKSLIEDALLEARRASDSKSRFVAAASHDLRQPLHALTMFLSTLTFHVPTPEARRLLDRTKDAAQLLEEQFDSLLDLSRFDVGAIVADVRTFRVDQTLERLLDGLQGDADARGLAIERELVPAVASSDPVLVARLLRNLLDNAVKYTKEGTITVRMTQASERIRIDVIDTGPGIAEEDQARIFEGYVQLGNPGRQRRLGVGLGLSIVSRIDRLLGLQLALRSKAGEGACFSIALPAAHMADAVAEPAHGADVLSFRTGQNVWVVDDDPASLEAMRAQLAAWGARVSTYDAAEPLLEDYAGTAAKPDWLFCDDMLGGSLSGLDVATRLRDRFGHSRICLFTGNTSRSRLDELRGSGFPVIVKPARAAALAELLSEA